MSKLSSPQERSKKKNLFINKLTVLASLASIIAGIALAPVAAADNYDRQIEALRQQNNSAEAAKQNLAVSEETLSARVASLRASIAELEAQIARQQAKADAINKKIAEIEAEMSKHRVVLASAIRQMYMDDQVSDLEKVAMSKNWSDYADKEQYNISVENKVKRILDRINELKSEQEKQKAEAEKILGEQKARQSQLAADKAEADRLLSMNQAQQAEYDRAIGANNSKIAKLRAEQAAINARNFIGGYSYSGSGGYPWANVPFPNSMADPWGMYKRQCVSYTAWKVAASGRYMPYWGGRGNANRWDDNARAAGIPVDYSPRAGDVAISNAGTYGHAMYVEAVHGDGTISISQYNAGWDGRYSEGRRSTAGLVFIHF